MKSVRLDADMEAKLERAARALATSQSEFIRDALARRGLITALLPRETPPEGVFDAVIHLSGLTLPQVTRRLAAAAQLGPLPPRDDPAAGIATDIDWLTARLAERAEPFTVLADALGLHLDQFQRIQVDPCSVSVVRYTALRPFVVRLNDTGGGVEGLVPPKRKARGRSVSRRGAGAQVGDAVVGGAAGP